MESEDKVEQLLSEIKGRLALNAGS
jgi:hypothetical protein